MRTIAEVRGAARIRPTAPKRLRAAIVTMSTASGWMRSGAHGERLHDLLKRSVREQLHHDHASRRVGSGAAERHQDGERRRGPRSKVRNVSGEECDRGDRPRERNAEDQRAHQTTTALKAATSVTPRK